MSLDDDVYQAALYLSRVSGKRLGKVVSELIRRGLAPAAPPAKKSSRRFPTFEVPADAPMISAAQIERVIDEEGLV